MVGKDFPVCFKHFSNRFNLYRVLAGAPENRVIHTIHFFEAFVKNLTAILLDEADVKDASAVMTNLSDEANEAAMTAPIVVFRGQIVKNRFGSLSAAHAPAASPGAIGTAFGGGVYAGLTIDDGKLAHLVLLPDAAHDITWDDAIIWAGTVGADLPTRQELITLYQNLKSEFRPEWHWSSQQHEAFSDCAWGQGFSYGGQYGGHKSYAGRARAVRRLPI